MNGSETHPLEAIAAWLLALLWLAPLAYAFWSAIHPAAYATSFSLSAPLTLENFVARVESGAVRPLLPQYSDVGRCSFWLGSSFSAHWRLTRSPDSSSRAAASRSLSSCFSS